MGTQLEREELRLAGSRVYRNVIIKQHLFNPSLIGEILNTVCTK